jgi:hypothetical protein
MHFILSLASKSVPYQVLSTMKIFSGMTVLTVTGTLSLCYASQLFVSKQNI